MEDGKWPLDKVKTQKLNIGRRGTRFSKINTNINIKAVVDEATAIFDKHPATSLERVKEGLKKSMHLIDKHQNLSR